MSEYNENINIAILGPVSAGKTTLLNALFSNTYSDMKRKKTTMLPQIYQISHDKIDLPNDIFKKNKDSNDEILKLRESNQYNHNHFKEIKYNVPPIPDFINLPDNNATYSILDMPGLNCSGDGNKIYYDYLLQNSHKIDIYILVFDVNSALNTTDEENILKEVNKYIEINKHGYVHVLINKCDDIEFDSKNKFKFSDDEIEDLYKRCIEISNKNLKDVRGKISISPLCSSELYVYRVAMNNIESLDEKQLDNIIKIEGGKKQFAELNEKGIKEKRKFISGLIKNKKSNLTNDWMKDTGYTILKKSINEIMENYYEIILHHIEQDFDKHLANITSVNMDISVLTDTLEQINNRLIKIISCTDDKLTVFDALTKSMKTKLNILTNELNTYIDNGLTSYIGKDINTIEIFINKMTLFYDKIRLFFEENPILSSLGKLKTRRFALMNVSLSNGFDVNIFSQLYKEKKLDDTYFTKCITNTITNKIIDFSSLLDEVSAVTSNNKKYTKIIIDIFLDNYVAHDNFMEDFKLIAKYTKKNILVITCFMHKQFATYDDVKCSHYMFWINNNYNKFANNEIKYLYYNLAELFKHKPQASELNTTNNNYELFVGSQKYMQSIYNDFTEIFCATDTNRVVIELNNKEDPAESEETLSEEEEYNTSNEDIYNNDLKECESSSENSEVYNDSDDSDTIYRKTLNNAKIRTVRYIKNGGEQNSETESLNNNDTEKPKKIISKKQKSGKEAAKHYM